MSHGVTTVSKAPRRNGGRCASAEHGGRARRVPARAPPACAARRASPARRERKLIELERVAASDAVRDEQQQRIEIECYRQRGRRPRVQIVGEPAGAGAEHERSARFRAAEQSGEHVERGVVFGVAPTPIAMDVGVIGRQPLIRRQASAQREVCLVVRRRVARARAVRATRAAARHDRAWRARGSRVECAWPACSDVLVRARSELLPFALEPLQREVQATAPFAERGVRFREQPGQAGDVREVDRNSPRTATPRPTGASGASQRGQASRSRRSSAVVIASLCMVASECDRGGRVAA